MPDNARLTVGFAPWMVAGVRSQWENMRPYVMACPDIQAYVVEIHPYREGGLVERLPGLPSTVKGNVRSIVSAGKLLRVPRLDVLWVHNIRAALPFLLSKGLYQGTKVICALDATSAAQTSMSQHYNVAPGGSLTAQVRDSLDAFCLRHGANIVAAWSDWAARAIRSNHGLPESMLRVMPPGIDLARWPARVLTEQFGTLPRILFVGGDFARKGGDLLLDVFQRQLRGRCELHLVTKANVPNAPDIRSYPDLGPNDPRLIQLYHQCDVFVLPTYADTFSMASLEAMASGLPVVTSNVGGIPEIVAEGLSGRLIQPGDGRALAGSITQFIEDVPLRARMGQEGRRIVEARFSAEHNSAALLRLIGDFGASRGT